MKYALHETLEVQEMAALRTVNLTKSNIMVLLVSDPELKEILRQEVKQSVEAVQELKEIMKKAEQQEMMT
ncbi:hypothetical protein [Paenibacillus illinoisensis]|uniref:hypothetical protein n=1 Tax=Paenibacillus illinoisensis TaxID=59845 RepID=UPI00301739A3